MTAPTGLIVAWLVIAFVSIHAVSYVAHRGNLSAFWVAAYIVSLVVPIWSPCTLIAVAAAISLQIIGPAILLKIKFDTESYAIIAFTAANYLVWGLSYATTDSGTPSVSTLGATGGASVALFGLAVAAPMIAKLKPE